MILEIAILHIDPPQAAAFESAYASAQRFLSSADGYLGHELQRCLEVAGKYILLVRWESVAAHEEGFRSSTAYEGWRGLIHPYLLPPTVVEHFERVGR